MESSNKNKQASILLIIGAIALLVPYSILTGIFEYPAILRQDTGVILTKFNEGGSSLIWTWFAFALTGLPLLPAYVLLGEVLEKRHTMVRTATTLGVIGLIVQMVGLLRWTFVIPVIADSYVHNADPATKAAAIMAFKTVHQFGGVLLGEHLGQLFTIAWTVMMSLSFARLKLFPKWLTIMGIFSTMIYLVAQAELFATVMPQFPVLEPAGFIGSTLWLLWLILVGSRLLKTKI